MTNEYPDPLKEPSRRTRPPVEETPTDSQEEARREALPWIATRLGLGVSAAISASPANATAPA